MFYQLKIKAIAFSSLIILFAVVSTNAFAIKESLADKKVILSSPSSQSVTTRSFKGRNVDDLYMVILQEQPLATANYNINDTAKNLSANKQSFRKNKTRLNVHSINSQRYIKQLKSNRNKLLEQFSARLKQPVKKVHEYNYALNGFTTRLTAQQVGLLKQDHNIKKIVKVEKRKLLTDSGPSFINAPNVWQGLASPQSSFGEGVVVAIFDSGITPSHPSFAEIGGDGYVHINPLGNGQFLGECAKSEFAHYCNNKLIGIWSHPEITDEYTPLGDDKVGIDHDGHGTHVAAIAAGNILKNVPVYNVVGELGERGFDEISGVAPHANIVAYQVCAADFGCWPDLTALAVEHAIANGVDVINYSVGGDNTDPWSSIDALAFLSARAAGIHVAVSAGNDGPELATISSPANSPWLTSVAAVNHGRDYDGVSISFSGGNTTLSSLTGAGITSQVSGPIVFAGDFGDEDCLNPFSAGTFSGKIVVCIRNTIARVEKGSNVLAGNAIGMVLINDPNNASTDNIVADHHVLPAIHLNNSDGQHLMQWLDSGNNHHVNIAASVMVNNELLADVVDDFSARGLDSNIKQWLLPAVAAPGVEIYSANSNYQPHYNEAKKTESDYIFKAGTSMASPSVAGALALIHAIHPDWTPAQAQSALMLTASFSVKKVQNEENIPATFLDAGAGSIRIDNAIRSGLLLDVTTAEYEDADTLENGVPATLNLPALVNENCQLSCQWQRRFIATDNASWSSSFTAISDNINIAITPANFELEQGEEITLTFTADITSGFSDDYGLARVVLTPNNNNIAGATLPVVASFIPGSFPSEINIVADTDQGSIQVNGIKSIATDDLLVQVHSLSPLNQQTVFIPRDGIDNADWPNNVINDANFYYSRSITIPSNSKYLAVEITQTDSPDLDLYIGRDNNGDGRPNAAEMNSLACQSASITALEICQIANPASGNYFIAIHNYGNSAANNNITDEVQFEWAVVTQGSENLSVIYDEVAASNADIDLTLNWFPPLVKGQDYLSVFEVGTTKTSKGDIGIIPFKFSRSNALGNVTLDKNNIVAGDNFSVNFSLDANTSTTAKNYQIVLALPKDSTVVEDMLAGVVADNKITWQIVQPVASEPFIFTATFSTSEELPTTNFNVNYTVDFEAESVRYNIGTLAIKAVIAEPVGNNSTGNNSSNSSSSGGTFGLLLIALFYIRFTCFKAKLI